jgi:hypothetical protein
MSKLSGPQQKVFDNFVRKMRELDVLESTEQQGTYAFKHELHRLNYMLEAGVDATQKRL